jgi:hypothetical protein
VSGEIIFVSDWGPYDEIWSNPESFVAVVHGLVWGSVGEKIEVPNNPEGMISVNGKVLVACSAAGEIAVIDATNEELEKTVAVAGNPYFFFNHQSDLYLYARTGENIYFHRINTNDFSVTHTVEIALANSIYNGNFAIGENGEVYVITTGGDSDKVARVSLSNGDIIDEAFYTGSNFYGLGYHRSEGILYIGENNGWQGNGTVMKVSANGELTGTIQAGRGPSGFVFR